MKAVSLRSLALATLASLAMATSSSAVTVLQYAQQNPNDFVTATVAGSTTTLSATNQPIFINNLAGAQVSPPGPALLTIAATSTGTATTTAGTIEQLFSGTITIRSTVATGSQNILTTVFTNAVLSGLAGGGSVSLVGSRPPGGVLFTSDIPAIQNLIAGNPPENFAISFSNLSTPLTVVGTTVGPFTAQNTGTFATGTAAVVPEPSGLVLAGMAMVAGLGGFGWRRRQASRA